MAHNEPHLSGDQEQKHRKSGAQVSSPWIANPSISLPVPPSQQYHDQRSKWPAPSNFGDSGFLHGGWGNWPSWQSGAAQSAASETTSPERLALNSSTEAPQPYDLSRYASATSFSPAYPYFQAHTDPKPPTFPPQDPRYGPNPYGMAPMPMPVPGDNRPRSSSATSLSSTDSSNPGGDLLDDLDPTPRAHAPQSSHLQLSRGASRSRSGSSLSLSQTEITNPSRNPSDTPGEAPFTASPSTYGPNGPPSWMAHGGFTTSPASSVVSLPNYVMDGQMASGHTADSNLWGQFNNMHFDSQSNLTSPASSSFSEPVTTGPPFSPIQTDTSLAADEPASRKTRTRKSANQPNITNNPLFWRSQTTRATKQASIARRKPGSVARFSCPYCGECFTRKYNLSGHVRAHNGERPFTCDQPGCSKAFSRQHDLKRHRELHATAEKYRCSSCLKGFRKIEALARHYRSEPSCVDPYPNLDFSVLPDLYLSSAVLQGGELPTGAPPTPDTAQDPNSLSQQQQEPRNSLASSTASDSYESVQSAFF